MGSVRIAVIRRSARADFFNEDGNLTPKNCAIYSISAFGKQEILYDRMLSGTFFMGITSF